MDTRNFTQEELDKYFSPTGFNDYTLQTDDSGASSMQHMAIVKDFLITFE
jgi:phosphoketolase